MAMNTIYPNTQQLLTAWWVNGENEARNMYAAPGSFVVLMDRENQRFYTKAVSVAGDVVFKAFTFKEDVTQSTSDSSGIYVTKDELALAMSDLKEYISKAVTPNKYRGKQSSKENNKENDHGQSFV